MKKVLGIIKAIDWNEVSAGTIVRYVCSFLVGLNQILAVFDLAPVSFSENMIYRVVTMVLTIVILLINTYKDNPTSKESIIGHRITNILKEKEDTPNVILVQQASDGSWSAVDSDLISVDKATTTDISANMVNTTNIDTTAVEIDNDNDA